MKVVCSVGTTENAEPVTKCHIPEDLNPHVVNYKDTSHHSKIVILCMFFAVCTTYTYRASLVCMHVTNRESAQSILTKFYINIMQLETTISHTTL